MSQTPDPRGFGPSTHSVHTGSPERVPNQPVVHPIVQSSTFFGGGHDQEGPLLYTGYGNNPNQREVEEKVAALEGGEAAVALASGQAATAMTLLALTRAGDHIVASDQLYGATKLFLQNELPKRGVRTDFVDPAVSRKWRKAITPKTRLLFHEVPTNPTMRVYDPRPLGLLAQETGVALVVDGTFASPINLRLLDLGADAVIQSATKYLGGHSDLVGGVVSGSRPLIEEVTSMLRTYGPVMDPHCAWLLSRGLRTLPLRMARHNESALALAGWLEALPEVRSVLYPGLETHPDHAIAVELMTGFGGMIGLVLEGGGPAADIFAGALAVAMQAPSLGGVQTLVSQPRYTSHVGQTAAEREAMGIPDGFLRISVGLEDIADLKADFAEALRRSAHAS